MRTHLALLTLLSALVLAACGGGDRAVDPAGDDAAGGLTANPDPDSAPDAVPAADGAVRSRMLVTVMDTGKGAPELCLGPVAESYPPQCGGPAIEGWSWKATARGMHETQGDVRWGQFAVTGTWDGERFAVTEAVPAALYDAMPTEEPTYPPPREQYTQAELDEISRTLADRLPGAQGSYAADGHVLVDVVYDDGSLQAWADETYGRDVVIVTGALVDA